MKVYAISGLGADKRVFEYLTVDYNLITIDWIPPQKNEEIHKYALRISSVIDSSEPFVLIGVSFGGVVAIEISKILSPSHTILISSIETSQELPSILKFIGKTNILKLTPSKLFDLPRPIAFILFGTDNKKLLSEILDDTDLEFVKWALSQLSVWKNEELLSNCTTINGTKDKLLPVRKSKTNLIQYGGHFMIVDNAPQISKIINDCLSEISSFPPISLTELENEINQSIIKMTKYENEFWSSISISPCKWKYIDENNRTNKVWVFAIFDDQIIWYDDVEEGFNVSNFEEPGVFSPETAEQDELVFAIRKLLRINIGTLQLYIKYDGDADGFARMATAKDKQILNSHKWSLIDKTVQDLTLIDQKQCSKEYQINSIKSFEYLFSEEAFTKLQQYLNHNH